ncbi:uridine kinase-like protein 3 isoform X1 [Tanacetum coccineum]
MKIGSSLYFTIRLNVMAKAGRHIPTSDHEKRSIYTSIDFDRRLCGVSVIRSGESMENALRACCKGIKIGKILIHKEGENYHQVAEDSAKLKRTSLEGKFGTPEVMRYELSNNDHAGETSSVTLTNGYCNKEPCHSCHSSQIPMKCKHMYSSLVSFDFIVTTDIGTEDLAEEEGGVDVTPL